MFKPELIVYLWMFPFFVFIVLPVVCLPFFVMVQQRQSARLARQAEESDSISGNIQYSAINDNREYPRKAIDGLFARVFSGDNSYDVAVNNISKRGVCFDCPVDEIGQQAESLGMMLTESGKNFYMQVKPQWNQKQGKQQSVGASILNSFDKWEEFARFV